MTPEHRQTIVQARTTDYSTIMRTTLFAFLGICAVLHFGDGFSLPLLALTLVVTAYGVLAGGTALDDINNLKADMSEEFSATGYGAGVAKRDVLMLKTVSAACIGVLGLACVLGIIF